MNGIAAYKNTPDSQQTRVNIAATKTYKFPFIGCLVISGIHLWRIVLREDGDSNNGRICERPIAGNVGEGVYIVEVGSGRVDEGDI